jgi:hypothetical protein
MQVTGRAFLGVLCGAFVCASAWSAPSVEYADGVARKALELKQYADVAKAYIGLAPQELNDQSFYRMAIAQQRLGNSAEAQRALDQALKRNPQGSFASTPERLAQLKQDIAKGLAAKTPFQSAAQTPAQAPPPHAAPASGEASPFKDIALKGAVVEAAMSSPEAATPASAAPAVAIPATAAPATPASAAVEPAAPMTAAQKPAVAAPAQAPVTTPQSNVSDLTGIRSALIVLALVVLLVVAALMLLSYRKIRMIGVTADSSLALAESFHNQINDLVNQRAQPVSDVGDLVSLRGEIVKMKELIEAAGTTGSVLYKSLVKLEPIVEMEIGRNHFRRRHDTQALTLADQKVLDSVKHLEDAPLTLDRADPNDLLTFMFGGRERLLTKLEDAKVSPCS